MHKRTIIIISLIFTLLSSVLFLPVSVYAETTSTDNSSTSNDKTEKSEGKDDADDSDASSDTQRYQSICDAPGVSEEFKQASGCPETPVEKDLPTVITNIVKNIIFVCGLISVIFIVVGGITYMTSEGESTKTKKAKDTILYAVIGLIICSLAFAIVNWIIISALEQGTTQEQENSEQKKFTPEIVPEEPEVWI